jgi:hypothetical protein
MVTLVELLALVRVTFLAALVVPASRLPKSRLVAEKVRGQSRIRYQWGA